MEEFYVESFGKNIKRPNLILPLDIINFIHGDQSAIGFKI